MKKKPGAPKGNSNALKLGSDAAIHFRAPSDRPAKWARKARRAGFASRSAWIIEMLDKGELP